MRFAYKLARGNARWKSGHEALAELTPDELNFWMASYKLDTWGGEYERHSQQTAILFNAIRILEKVMGGRDINDESPLMREDDLIPHRKRKKESLTELQQGVAGLDDIVGLPT